MLIDSLCQSYHWTLREAMSVTMVQIIMLNHASWVNAKRSGLLDRKTDVRSNEESNPECPKFSEMKTDAIFSYFKSEGPA